VPAAAIVRADGAAVYASTVFAAARVDATANATTNVRAVHVCDSTVVGH
jgi:hypothetical protein